MNSLLIENNKKLLKDLYNKFNIQNIKANSINEYYNKFTEILTEFQNRDFETIKKVVEEIKTIEQQILSGGKLNKPLEGNVKTIIKLRRTEDEGDIQIKIGEYEKTTEEKKIDNSNYSFTLGAQESIEIGTNMRHRYLKYKNDDNAILISGYIFSDIEGGGEEGKGWNEIKYKQFSEWLLAERNPSNLIITLGLTGSGKSHLADKAKLIIKEKGFSSYEFNFNEEGGKWSFLNSIEDRQTYSTYLNPQSSRSHLLQINDSGTVVDLAGAEDSFTFKNYISKIDVHLSTLETQEKAKTEKEKLYVKYYLQGHSGLLIREAFNRFEQIKNYWEKDEENIAFFKKFVETLEKYEEMFILSIKEITQEITQETKQETVLGYIDLTEISKFNFEKFEEYMEIEGLKEIENVESINLKKEINDIVKKINKKTGQMTNEWWKEGPTIFDFNKGIEYPIITSTDIEEMQKNLTWFDPYVPTTPYHNQLFMYFYLRKLYKKDIDMTYQTSGDWNAARTFLKDIKDEPKYLEEILKGIDVEKPTTIFDILKSVPNLKTEREEADEEEADEEEASRKKWVAYFSKDLTSVEQDMISDAMNIIKENEIEYNSILGRIIRDHLNKKNSSNNLQIERVDGDENDNNEIIKKLRHCYLLLINYFNRIYEGYMINKTLKELEIRAKAKNKKPKLPFGYEYGESSLVELFCYDYLNPTNPEKYDKIKSTFLDTKYEVDSEENKKEPTLGEFLDSPEKNLSIILAIDTNKEKGKNEILNSEEFYNTTIYNGIMYQLKLYKTREAMPDLYKIFQKTLIEDLFNITTGKNIYDFNKPLEEQKSMKLSPMELTNVLSTGLLKPYSLKNSEFDIYFDKYMTTNFIPGALLNGIEGGRSNKIINQNIRVNELSKLKKLYKELNKK